jgi:hypothetical protein
MRIYLPGLGYPTPATAEERQEEAAKLRAFEGTGGPFIPVPGLLKLERVAMRGVVLEEVITREVLVAPAMQQAIPISVDCCSIIVGLDETPLLFRHPWSNDGIWQAGEWVYVMGEWDAQISPPPEIPLRPLERVHHPVLTTSGEVTAEGEVRMSRGPGRPRKD